MACSVDSHLLSPACHCSMDPCTHAQSDHGGRDGGYPWAPQHGFPLISDDLPMAAAESNICQQQKPVLNLIMGQFSGHFNLLISLNQQTKKGLNACKEVIDPDYHERGEIASS